MRSTLIFGVIGATALTIGLGVGVTLAGGDPTPPAPTEPTMMMDTANGGHMLDTEGMTSMMSGDGMTNMMNANGMDAMHVAMHESLRGTVSADVLASCDAAHASMANGSTPTSTDMGSDHAEHHPGSQP